MRRVELLAPAGNYDGLKGALKAGADAIYLGGQLFGARAYADNFTQEEICDAIKMAHIFGKRVYLTVNTLVKEKELDQLYDFLLPFYQQGLDGVIIQDLGVLSYIRECFPGMELHASTQMSLTGSRGTAFLKEAGVSRIVPARELSLAEMKTISERTGVEIEAFIHGAMCYCYSGQCLLSSMLGGRSGNRGRCAQPCRLPYSVDGGKTCYPLSMRDMCTLDMLPELIEAGIASFKIEGRMKKPAYAAGVTAVYRKYIDLYYMDPENYYVSEKDREYLKSLYIRSKISEGYYHRHNGREMLTVDSPAYSGAQDSLLAAIEKEYIESEMKIPVAAEIFLKPDQPAILILKGRECEICCQGNPVQAALKQPLSEEKIAEQIRKSGNTFFDITQVQVYTESEIFMPVRSLNELRRQAVFMLEEELIRQNGLAYEERKSAHELAADGEERQRAAKLCLNAEMAVENEADKLQNKELHAVVSALSQLKAAISENCRRIYLEYGLLDQMDTDWIKRVKEEQKISFYLAAPYIVREKDICYLNKIAEALETGIFEGVLIRNTESCQYFREVNACGELVLDHNMYLWNHRTCGFWEDKVSEYYLPVEENGGEWRELLQKTASCKLIPSAMVYGREVMMLTANCVRKTNGNCRKIPGISMLKDRYNKEFPVYTDCRCCYNVIYNSVPLSLHSLFKKQEKQIAHFRLDFTVENETETENVIRYFTGLFKEYKEPFYKEFTTGHYKRGVE